MVLAHRFLSSNMYKCIQYDELKEIQICHNVVLDFPQLLCLTPGVDIKMEHSCLYSQKIVLAILGHSVFLI